MEVEVLGLPGVRDCFAALPLDMIDALQGRHKTHMFKAVLELRLPNAPSNQGPWYLAWAGATSTSSSIEISKKLADSVGLPCGARFHVRALRDVAHAETVELEPATEDDWEILELNAGFVEDHVLSQVGVLCSGQRFPIWVEGGNALMLHVITTKPKRVVQLVPGSELVVAPKLRKVSPPGPNLVSPKESSSVKAVLRVQELHPSLMQPVDNLHCSIAPTTAVFVSEQTAKAFSLNNGQLVVISAIDRLSMQKEDSEKDKMRNLKGRAVSSNQATPVVLSMVYCELVAKGHAMLASSLCYMIGAPIHSRIEMKSYSESSMVPDASATIAPIKFKSIEGSSNDDSNTSQDKSAMPTVTSQSVFPEWQRHKIFLRSVSKQTCSRQRQEYCQSYDYENEGSEFLFKLWVTAQSKTISKHSLQQCTVIPIMAETALHFLVEQELTTTEETSENDHVGCQFKSSSEALVFLLSLHQVKDPSERIENSEVEMPGFLSASAKGCLFLDVRGLQAEDVESVGSMTIAPLRIIMPGHPRYVRTPLKMNDLEDKNGISLSSLTWLEGLASSALQRLQASLSPVLQAKRCKLGLPSPGYVLLHGPAACGKTKLALAIANELERNSSILCHRVMVKCAELAGEQAQAVRAAIQEAVFEAVKHAPSLIIFDDLDMAIPSNLGADSSEPSTSSMVVAEYLSDLLDTFRVKRRHQYDRCVSFVALAKEVSSLPAPLCSSGRFDLHIALSAPGTSQRAAILSQELENRRLVCPEGVLSGIAGKCDGYDAADLEVLVDRAVHVAAPRLLFLSSGQKVKKTKGHCEQVTHRQRFKLVKEDFEQALDGFSPVSMRDISKPSNKVGPLTWKDVGGLNETCRALQEMLELPVKYSKIFSKAPLRLRTGVLLYGPPGCGKTHVAGIAAAACSLRLISVKGPEILNKYIGASEQGVRDLFAKASAAAPCILFFDEFDAIAPKRGHDNTGVTDRVVNQLLTELDGVEALNGVFVFAATSRPDLLDAALLRPGRLDRLLLCDFPTASERLEILQVLSRKLPLADDVRLDSVASLTDNFSGADLQAVLSDAQLEAVHSFLSDGSSRDGASLNESKRPVISMAALTSVLLKARPSVSDQERVKLYSIYDSFISSRSMTDKARDAKGKRATLA